MKQMLRKLCLLLLWTLPAFDAGVADYRSSRLADDVHLGTFGLLTLGERFAKVISERGR